MKRLLLAALLISGGVGAFMALPKESVLAGYATPLEGRTANQRHNARLAILRLNGAVIKPNQVFSFNQKVGTFSRDRGFKRAPVSYNGQLIDDWGGGVCQASTTLYNAALLSGMTIVERNRHRFCPSYVPPGRDAAVAFSNIDLRFKNPHSYPVRIRARIDEQAIRIELLGPQELENRPTVTQEVKETLTPATYTIGHPSNAARVRNTGKLGCQVAVYRTQGQTKELISEDTYPAMNRVIQYR